MADAAVIGECRLEAARERYGPERCESLAPDRLVLLGEQRGGHGFPDLGQPFQFIRAED